MARPSTYSQSTSNPQEYGDKSSPHHHQSTHHSSSRTPGNHLDQKFAKKDPELPSSRPRGQGPSERSSANDKLLSGSGSPASISRGNYVGPPVNDHKDTALSNKQEYRPQSLPVHPMNQERTRPSAISTQPVPFPGHHAAKDHKLSGFVSGDGQFSMQSSRGSASGGSHVGSLANDNKDSVVSTIQESRVQSPYVHLRNQGITPPITGSTQSITSAAGPRAAKREYNSPSSSGSNPEVSLSEKGKAGPRANDHKPTTFLTAQDFKVQAPLAHTTSQAIPAVSAVQEPQTIGGDNKFQPLPFPGSNSQTSFSIGSQAGLRASNHKDTTWPNVQETPFQSLHVHPTPTNQERTKPSAAFTQTIPFQGPHIAKGDDTLLPPQDSGPQAFLSAESHAGPYTSDYTDTPLPDMQESPAQSLSGHRTSQERATTQVVTTSPDHQSTKGDSIFRSLLFGFGRRKTTEPAPSSDSASHKTSSGNVIHRNNEFPGIDELKEGDILIAIMGPTGAGKSSFIHTATHKDISAEHDQGSDIGHDLNSKTASVKTFRIQVPGEDADIVLVDTPGFDDTHKTDREILAIITNWLEAIGKKNLRPHGVLYLHRISDNRMAGTPLRNLELFRKICGHEWFHRVTFLTTMWDTLWDVEEGEDRVQELRENFWAAMIDAGSRLERYDNNHESAWRILKSARDNFGKAEQKVKPRLQKETADEGKALPKTGAGRKLYEQTNELQRQRKGLIRSLDKQINRLEVDDEVGTLLRDQRDQLKSESETAEKDLGQLKGGLAPHKKLKSWLKSKEVFSS